MRLWSIHPIYLDAKGLVALWREGLLALKVLSGNTKGYRNHPQLIRFKETGQSSIAIVSYLHGVVDQADRRGYSFNRKKIPRNIDCNKIRVGKGQIDYEFKHLLGKLKIRDFGRYSELKSLEEIQAHPLFEIVDGAIEEWEVIR